MAEEIWKAKKASMILEDDSDTEKNVGGLQDTEIEFSWDINELEAQSIKPLDREVTAMRINVSATYAKFDMTAIEDIINYDDANSEISDTPDPVKFVMRGEFTNESGTEEHIEVSGIVFDSLTLPWGREEWVTYDLSGTGTDAERITPA